MKKIVSILGARPQFVKAAVLSRIIKEQQEFEEVIIHTGQHFDANMSAIFFKEMEIPAPSYNLNINGGTHGLMTGRMLERIEEVLLVEKPTAVLVYGDTNSTLAGALAAKKLGIDLVHVEAGLRSFNMSMPEEVNRILTDRIADLLFCPTQTAVQNLQKEGFDNLDARIELCGDIMHDSVTFYADLSTSRSDILKRLKLSQKEFVLATIHRQENTDSKRKLSSIIEGLNKISKEIPVILPMHPRTRDMLDAYQLQFDGLAIDPLGYFDMLQLLQHCSIVVTDSGGLQKEAYFNSKPCLIAREETEWLELVDKGYAAIVGADARKIYQGYRLFGDEHPVFKPGLYGEQVGLSIYRSLQRFLER
ncbi:non-hydrolyzing UDP-N-acetylglucosamine 2-epimerase [Lutimonas sp.]|uniref:non-hydrolyzing UDP-N-acetylglucosamine 2-epimerase n=1 Tax=Lutimonas sp. TaxID=1872403 RepID=UPI003D9AE269